MCVYPRPIEPIADPLTLCYNRYSVSTACLIEVRARMPIQKHLPGVFGLVSFWVAVRLTVDGQNTSQ